MVIKNRKFQIEAKWYFIPNGSAKLLNVDRIKCVDYIITYFWWKCKLVQPLWKTILHLLFSTVKNQIPKNQILHLEAQPRKPLTVDINKVIDSSKVCFSKSKIKQKPEETQISIDRRMEIGEWITTTKKWKLYFQ